MDNNSDDQVLIMKSTFESSRQESNYKNKEPHRRPHRNNRINDGSD